MKEKRRQEAGSSTEPLEGRRDPASMSLRKSLRRSFRSSHKVKSSDEGQVKGGGEAAPPTKVSSTERSSRSSETYLSVDDVTVPSGGVTLEAANSSFESHDDVSACGTYQSSGSEEDLPAERSEEAALPESALYEFLFRACALMALENDDFKQLIEQQQQASSQPSLPSSASSSSSHHHLFQLHQPSEEAKTDDDDEEEEEGSIQGAEGGGKRSKLKVRRTGRCSPTLSSLLVSFYFSASY